MAWCLLHLFRLTKINHPQRAQGQIIYQQAGSDNAAGDPMAGSGHPFLRARSARIDIEVGMGIFDPFPLRNPVRRSGGVLIWSGVRRII